MSLDKVTRPRVGVETLPLTCDNETRPQGAGHTSRPLTHSLDYGKERTMTKRKPLEERLWSRVVEKSGCWVYTGTVSRYGYGRISSGGRHGRVLDVHRVVYELLVADVPPGLQLDHLCRNRACCNPYHLEPVTQKENIRRGLYGSPDTHPGAIAMRAKTHCPEGHPYRGENLYVDPRGYRGCRACRRAAGSRRRSQGGGSRNA